MATIGDDLSDTGIEGKSGVIGSLVVTQEDKGIVLGDAVHVEQERVSTPLMVSEVGARVTFPNLLACGLTAEELEDLEAELENKQQ
ncbi:hypothetical protein PSENEW3_00000142 [Picochlorum sp. SENEW3]|nr:hypothetical protein PSENEW3_00000142 [Picochlorum sp. SENEW3]